METRGADDSVRLSASQMTAQPSSPVTQRVSNTPVQEYLLFLHFQLTLPNLLKPLVHNIEVELE